MTRIRTSSGDAHRREINIHRSQLKQKQCYSDTPESMRQKLYNAVASLKAADPEGWEVWYDREIPDWYSWENLSLIRLIIAVIENRVAELKKLPLDNR